MIVGLESHGLSRANNANNIAAQAQVSRATVRRLANSTSKDHLSATVAASGFATGASEHARVGLLPA